MRWTAIVALTVLPGCVSRGELQAGLAEQARYTSKVVGFALDAHEEALATRRLLAEVLADHPRRAELLPLLASEQLEAKAERVAAARRELVEEGQRLLGRYAPAPD